MAKKPRTPPPPRVQAPRQRHDPSDMGDRARKALYWIAAAGILGLVVAVALIAFGGGSSAAAAAKTIRAAGCQYRRYPQIAGIHAPSLNPATPPKWNSFPPTSGAHFSEGAPFNQYSEPVPEMRLVHNLEHGGLILQYGRKVPQAQVDALVQWYQRDANAIVVAPLPQLGDKTALTAWTQWAECTGFDEKAANAFRKAFRYKAPEKIPKSALEPGA